MTEPGQIVAAQPHEMSRARPGVSTWLIVAVFAVAMAWVEAAVVFYLRTMVDRIVPYQPEPLPVVEGFVTAELVREIATLVMLVAVGILAGVTWCARLGYTAIAFGIWDILYYVFLKLMSGWPRTLLDWDVLFLLPLPWWGPVLAPVLISVLMIWWGTMATQFEHLTRLRAQDWRVVLPALCGAALALYVLMADTLRVAGQGLDAIRSVLPERFNWVLFVLALGLMAVPGIELTLRVCRANRRQNGQAPTPRKLECAQPVQS